MLRSLSLSRQVVPRVVSAAAARRAQSTAAFQPLYTAEAVAVGGTCILNLTKKKKRRIRRRRKVMLVTSFLTFVFIFFSLACMLKAAVRMAMRRARKTALTSSWSCQRAWAARATCPTRRRSTLRSSSPQATRCVLVVLLRCLALVPVLRSNIASKIIITK